MLTDQHRNNSLMGKGASSELWKQPHFPKASSTFGLKWLTDSYDISNGVCFNGTGSITVCSSSHSFTVRTSCRGEGDWHGAKHLEIWCFLSTTSIYEKFTALNFCQALIVFCCYSICIHYFWAVYVHVHVGNPLGWQCLPALSLPPSVTDAAISEESCHYCGIPVMQHDTFKKQLYTTTKSELNLQVQGDFCKWCC